MWLWCKAYFLTESATKQVNEINGPTVPRIPEIANCTRALCRAFEHAIDDEHISFGVYNLVSRNSGMRWEITSLARDVGFIPQDGDARTRDADREGGPGLGTRRRPAQRWRPACRATLVILAVSTMIMAMLAHKRRPTSGGRAWPT
jgi:hypothetical protein